MSGFIDLAEARHSPTWQERVQQAFADHSKLLETNPVRAHWNSAAVSASFGMAMSVARGGVAAMTNPPGQRLFAFLFVTRAVAPLYIIPFVIGSQVDDYEASWAKQNRSARAKRADMGGAADLG